MEKIPDELYRQIIETMPVFCVDLVVYESGKVLLTYRKNKPAKGEWWIPGGRLIKGERLIDAVKRKLKEETGLEAKKIEFIGLQEYFSEKAVFENVKTGTHTPAGIYLVEVKEGDVKLDSTSSDYKWIDKIEEDLNEYVKKALKGSGVFD